MEWKTPHHHSHKQDMGTSRRYPSQHNNLKSKNVENNSFYVHINGSYKEVIPMHESKNSNRPPQLSRSTTFVTGSVFVILNWNEVIMTSSNLKSNRPLDIRLPNASAFSKKISILYKNGIWGETYSTLK